MKNKFSFNAICFLAIVTVFTVAIVAQQKTDQKENACPMMDKVADKTKAREDCPMMRKGEDQMPDMKMDGNSDHHSHHDSVVKNGEKEMGFSQTATTHHFLIMKDGGAIQVETNDDADTGNRDRIRTHLTEIAKEFQNGIFTTPFAVHGQVPPGVPVMDRLKGKIRYTYEETKKGARVRISTIDPQALAAIHDFLKFQIEEHQTGDPTN